MKHECPECGANLKEVEEHYECLLCGYSTKNTSENEKPCYIG